jgi:hypothetical protein
MTDSQPQDTTPEGGSRPQPHDEPNEFGFAGDATAPQPERSTGESFGESVAVPAGDLTGAITGAIEEATDRDDSDR